LHFSSASFTRALAPAPAPGIPFRLPHYASVADIPAGDLSAAVAALNMKRIPQALPAIQMEASAVLSPSVLCCFFFFFFCFLFC